MYILFIILNFSLLCYILFKLKTISHSSTGLKVLFGFGVFCSFGSLVLLSTTDVNGGKSSVEIGSISYSILAIVLYIIYISRVSEKSIQNNELNLSNQELSAINTQIENKKIELEQLEQELQKKLKKHNDIISWCRY